MYSLLDMTNWQGPVFLTPEQLTMIELENQLEQEILLAPEAHEDPDNIDAYERRCRDLREEMSAMGVDIFDSIKPF